MKVTSRDGRHSATPTVARPQIVALEDLENFKQEILTEIKTMLKDFSGRSTKRWLKSYEVKKLLGISPGTLQNLRLNGTLPYTKVGGIIFYDYADIDAMLNKPAAKMRVPNMPSRYSRI